MSPAKKAAEVVAETPEATAPVRKPWTLATMGPAPLAEHTPVQPAKHGFRGRQVDQTPNEQYTVAGQLAAMPEKG